MTEKEIRIASDEYMDIPPVRAAIKIGDKEDLISHLKVAYANGMRDAITIVRKEEREKAIKAFVELSFVCTNCTEKCSVKCGQNCLMEKFIKILNK